MSQQSDSEVLDVAIVGGGVSGVYCGWRMLLAAPEISPVLKGLGQRRAEGKPRIAVFEMSDRIGGRLLSVTPPGMPHVRCELGGMRYVSTQPLVSSLVEKKLGLPVKPFVVGRPENFAYLRGKQVRNTEFSDPNKVPYNLDWAERGYGPGDLLGFAVDQVIPGATKMPPAALRDRLRTFALEGKPLYQHGFWNLLTRGLGHEAMQLATEASGYDTIALNWNAVDMIQLNFGDFGAEVHYKALVDGYEMLPVTLSSQYVAAGGELQRGQRLKSFDRTLLSDGSSGLSLEFVEAGTGRHSTVLARHLILAMPRRSLELIDQTGPLFAPEDPAERERLLALIRSVTPIPLFKMFVCYTYPWWEAVGVKEGQSVTDLPIRQCYYWAVEGRQEGANTSNTNAVMLATYDDTLNVSYWEGLQDPVKFQSVRPSLGGGDPIEIGKWSSFQAPQAMVEDVQRQLAEMHCMRYLPRPYDAAYMDWSVDPYGGGVNWWNIGVKSWEVIPAITRPRADLDVYICGEAYSDGQGWVEGALQTAEIVLQKHFGLPAPDWVGTS
jgi:monoamine oxidase